MFMAARTRTDPEHGSVTAQPEPDGHPAVDPAAGIGAGGKESTMAAQETQKGDGVRVTETEAKQARKGFPVLAVLVISTVTVAVIFAGLVIAYM
jgi:hypothetical protein